MFTVGAQSCFMIQYDVKSVFELKKMNYLIYLPFLKTILWYRIRSGWYQILLVLKLGVKILFRRF